MDEEENDGARRQGPTQQRPRRLGQHGVRRELPPHEERALLGRRHRRSGQDQAAAGPDERARSGGLRRHGLEPLRHGAAAAVFPPPSRLVRRRRGVWARGRWRARLSRVRHGRTLTNFFSPNVHNRRALDYGNKEKKCI